MRCRPSGSVSPGSLTCVGAVPRGPSSTRDVAPAGVAAVVDRVHPAALGDQRRRTGCGSRRVDLHRPAGHELGLVLAVVAAERVVGVGVARAVLVVEGRQVVGRVADGIQIDRRIAADSAYSGRRAKLFEGAPWLVLPPWATYSVLAVGARAACR